MSKAMLRSVLFAVFSISLLSVAGAAPKSTLSEITDEIQVLLEANEDKLTKDDKREVRKSLLYVRDILAEYGDAPATPKKVELTCVSRDNDNRSPYMVAEKSVFGTVDKKLPHTTFENLSECNDAIAGARTLDNDATMFCASRDNDGRSPYSTFFYLADGSVKVSKGTWGSFSTCMKYVNEAKEIKGRGLVFCQSRDNDSSSPFAKVVLDYETDELTQDSTIYNSIRDCYLAL